MNVLNKIIGCLLFGIAIVACSKQIDDEYNMQTLIVNAYISDSENNTRTNIVQVNDVYRVDWQHNDKIAIFSEESNIPAKFTLISGANTNCGVFSGQTNKSETYTAVYPYEIVKGEKELNKINLYFYNTQTYIKDGISSNTLPMYAYGKSGSLNFHNLGAIVQLQLTGTTILKSVKFSPNDNRPISGEAVLDLSNNIFPKIDFKESGNNHIVLDCEGIVLEPNRISNVYIVVPYGTYENGFTFSFETYTNNFDVVIDRAITLERSQIRKVEPILVEGEMPTPNLRSDKQLWYKTKNGTICSLKNETAFNANVVSHSYSNGWGIISFDVPPTRINDVVFSTPESITELYLPRTVEHIGMYAFSGISVNEILFPESLISLGVDAFSQCKNIKEIVIPEGVKSIGLEVFGGCTSLEYVTFPTTLETTEPYVFLHCDNLIKFKGNTKFISPDGRCFFTNSAYGYMSEPNTLDKVAGVNLETYAIPDNVLYIQNYALSGCKDLKTLTLHSKIKHCGIDPFPLSGKLKVIYANAQEPPSIQFDAQLKGLEVIYVPKESVTLYQMKDEWSDFKDIIQAISED